MYGVEEVVHQVEDHHPYSVLPPRTPETDDIFLNQKFKITFKICRNQLCYFCKLSHIRKSRTFQKAKYFQQNPMCLCRYPLLGLIGFNIIYRELQLSFNFRTTQITAMKVRSIEKDLPFPRKCCYKNSIHPNKIFTSASINNILRHPYSLHCI